MGDVWGFIEDEVLGMQWLSRMIRHVLEYFGIDVFGRVGGAIHFFIYDTIKIMVLLGVLILLISYVQSYFPPERTKKILGRYRGMPARCLAALLGTVTPFCSCSSIPLFMGFTRAGLPLGVTFSFLISSPMVDLGSLVLLMGIFGWKIAAIYVVFGLVIAVSGGTVIEKLRLEGQVEEYIFKGGSVEVPQEALRVRACLVSICNNSNECHGYQLQSVMSQPFTIFPKTSAFIQPSKRAFYYPSFLDNSKFV